MIHTSCLKQIKSLNFTLWPSLLIYVTLLMQGIKSFVVQPHFHARRSRDL